MKFFLSNGSMLCWFVTVASTTLAGFGFFFTAEQVYEKKPLTIKNFGIWLRYNSRSGTHNMYREYRDLTTAKAVTACCECLSITSVFLPPAPVPLDVAYSVVIFCCL